MTYNLGYIDIRDMEEPVTFDKIAEARLRYIEEHDGEYPGDIFMTPEQWVAVVKMKDPWGGYALRVTHDTEPNVLMGMAVVIDNDVWRLRERP